MPVPESTDPKPEPPEAHPPQPNPLEHPRPPVWSMILVALLLPLAFFVFCINVCFRWRL